MIITYYKTHSIWFIVSSLLHDTLFSNELAPSFIMISLIVCVNKVYAAVFDSKLNKLWSWRLLIEHLLLLSEEWWVVVLRILLWVLLKHLRIEIALGDRPILALRYFAIRGEIEDKILNNQCGRDIILIAWSPWTALILVLITPAVIIFIIWLRWYILVLWLDLHRTNPIYIWHKIILLFLQKLSCLFLQRRGKIFLMLSYLIVAKKMTTAVSTTSLSSIISMMRIIAISIFVSSF